MLLLASACGGAGNGNVSRLTAVIEFDTTNVPLNNIEETTSRVVDIIEQRVRDLGGSDFDATISEPSTISFEFANVGAETARDVFDSGILEFRQPMLYEDREIICQMTDGDEFHVESTGVTEGMDDSGQKEAQCIGAAGETGSVVWEPALAQDTQGEDRQLTGAYLKPNTTQVLTRPGQCVPACLQLEFTDEGSLLFEQITTRLINYPLAFFLDDQLIWAPQVRTAISNGQTLITGLSLDEANTLRIQLNTGALPMPVRLISIGPPQ